MSHIRNQTAVELLSSLEPESVHAVISDIPYGIGAEDWDVLHDNTNSAYLGTSPAQLKAGKVFKSRGKPLNGWSEADRQIPQQYHDWCMEWVPLCYKALKPGASCLIFAGRRLAHRCISAFEDSGFTLKDSLAWMRTRAPHRAQRMSIVFERRGDTSAAKQWEGWRLGNLRPVYEPVLWFTKPYMIGGTIATNALEHGVGGYNEEAFLKYEKEPNNVITGGFSPGESGIHPTQKPVRLMQTLIEMTTQPNQLVVDPFCGSGSTLVAAKKTNRQYIGGDSNSEYCRISEERLSNKYELFV
jgi:site-specific DNA-methyltransferase (adenine-specific)